MSSTWECPRHGPVHPLHSWTSVTGELIARTATSAQVPLWCPVPLLPGWSVTGLALAGDERSGARATALALSGPSPVGGPADLVLVAEEPGTGLGGRVAGSEALDPGSVADGPPDAKVEAAGHPTALWRCESADDRVALAGEAGGVWLWAVLWPPAAELVLMEDVDLHDLRAEKHAGLVLPFGAPTTRLP
jgi:hypothetical protein